MIHKFYRFLFLLPLAIMIASALFFSYLNQEIEINLLREKFEEKKLAVKTMAINTDEFILLDNDWETEHEFYQMNLVLSMEALDRTFMTFAAVYDENMNRLSKVTNNYSNFDPTIYPGFEIEVREKEIGDMIVHYSPGVDPESDIYLHYRWIPTKTNLKDRFLVVVGISKYTITTQTADWIKAGSVALIVVTSLLNMAMVAVIVRLMNKNKENNERVKLI